MTYGTADSNKWVQFEIHCPAGSEMLYAEPFSRYGKGGELWWNGWDTQENVGEKEMILQRGGKYTITDIKRDKNVLRVVMELNLDEGYDKWGDEWCITTIIRCVYHLNTRSVIPAHTRTESRSLKMTQAKVIVRYTREKVEYKSLMACILTVVGAIFTKVGTDGCSVGNQ